MIDLLFALYGIILIIFVVEVAGIFLVGLAKKVFKANDEAKKELAEIKMSE